VAKNLLILMIPISGKRLVVFSNWILKFRTSLSLLLQFAVVVVT
jgi:hypothetical protein